MIVDVPLSPAPDLRPTEWIAARLGGGFGAVRRMVPAGFEAYARILHPARDAEGQPVRWAEVALRTGGRVHARVQWHALIGSTDALNPASPRWPGESPERGNLPPDQLAALGEVLGRFTGTADRCWFGLWDGYAGIRVGEEVPLLQHPHRAYHLLGGPVSAVGDVGAWFGVSGYWPQSPNLFWPDDRAWCVATEIDFDSTLVGGSDALVEALLATEDLEVWPVRPDDSLAYDADRLNRLPGAVG
jgi:hypothetical protein